jgi:PAS domain S-box-containing protein
MRLFLKSKGERRHLQGQILWLLFGVTFFLSLGIGTVGGLRHYFTLEESIHDQARAAALIVVDNIASAIAFQDSKEALETLAGLRFIEQIDEAFVVDAEENFVVGLKIEGSDNERKTIPLSRPPRIEKRSKEFQSYEIHEDGDDLGTLYLSISPEITRALVIHTLTLDAVLFIICSLGIYFVGIYLGQTITRPLNSFIDYLETITKNKMFTHHYDGESSQDVQRLIEAFDELLNEVNKRDLSLKNQAESLEKTVVERTIELQKTIDSLELAERSVELSHDLILWLSLKGDIVYSNLSAQEMLKAENKKLIGKKFWDIDTSLDEDSWFRLIAEENALQKEVFSTTFTCSDATQCQVEYNCHRLETSEVALLCICARDVTELRQKDAQLMQQQRLESIGQLAAGIAHEINTPSQFINDNCNFLKSTFSDLLSYISVIEELVQNAEDGMASEVIAQEKEKRDVDYLCQEAPSAIEQTLEGIAKISKIVGAMKEFAHPGSESKVYYDLSSGLKSSVEVCRNEWKYCAQIEYDFDINSKEILCYPDQLNQVFLNLVVNAAHAIVSRFGTQKGVQGHIRIATHVSDESCMITVADNGCGIDKDVLDRIFDPFFTTKEVGVGTGQGLSIAHSIVVDKHGGTLEVSSKPGAGATFTITLPLTESTPK